MMIQTYILAILGIMTAHLRSVDPLEVYVIGHLVCTCGKSLAIFSCETAMGLN